MSEPVKVVPLNTNQPMFNAPNTMNHPLIVDREELYSYLRNLMTECGVFKNEEIEFCEGIMSRLDGQPGIDQVAPLIQTCESFLKAKRESHLSSWDKLKHQQAMRKSMEFVFITAYKQQRILVALSLRKSHPKYQAANLTGMIASQKLRVDVKIAVGLGYCESRKYLVKQALANPAYTKILFVDSDLLVPINIVETLSDYNLPVVCGIYHKKNPTNETVVSTVVPGGPNLFENVMVKAEENAKAEAVQIGCCGLGLTMIDMDIFKHKITNEDDWFQFVFENNPDGSRGRVLVGEDSRLIQLFQAHGIRTYCARNVVGAHCDFKTGKMYGPEWLVQNDKIVDKYKDKYTYFPSDLNWKEMDAPDNDNTFSSNAF